MKPLSFLPLFLLLGTSMASVISVPPDQEETIIQYLPEEGQRVAAGEIFVVLDCTKVIRDLKAASATVSALEKEIQQREKEVVEKEALKSEKLANAQAELTEAEEAFNQYLETDAPAQELALKANLAEAEAAHKLQEERYNTRDQLLAEGFIRKIEYAAEETAFKRSNTALEVAKLKLTSFTKYERKQTTEKLERAIKQKRSALVQTEATIKEEVAALRKEVQEKKEALEQATAKKEALSRKLQNTVIRATKEGTFTPVAERGAKVKGGEILGHLK